MAISTLSSDSIASLSASKLTGTLPDANAPSGSVIQVVSVTYATSTSTTSTTFQDTSLVASITPISSSSKIMIIVGLGDCSSSNASSNGLSVRLVKNGSALARPFGLQWCYGPSGNFLINSGNFSYLDSPATTSALTYKVQFACQSSGPTVTVFRDETQGSMVLMEIAG